MLTFRLHVANCWSRYKDIHTKTVGLRGRNADLRLNLPVV